MLPGAFGDLLDSHILLHYVRRDPLSEWVEERYGVLARPAEPPISVVAEGELRALALQFGWGSLKLERTEELLAHLVVVPLEFGGVIEAYARIEDYSRRTGRAMGQNDVWIAATLREAAGETSRA